MYKIYQVSSGDTIYSIADKVSSTKEELEELNGLPTNYALIPNSFLIVPAKGAKNGEVFDTYIVKQGDNIYQIARQLSVPYQTLLQINGLDEKDYIYPNQQLIIPKSNVNHYLTVEGDTLNTMAKRFNTTVDEILSQNEEIYLLPNQLFVYKRD